MIVEWRLLVPLSRATNFGPLHGFLLLSPSRRADVHAFGVLGFCFVRGGGGGPPVRFLSDIYEFPFFSSTALSYALERILFFSVVRLFVTGKKIGSLWCFCFWQSWALGAQGCCFFFLSAWFVGQCCAHKPHFLSEERPVFFQDQRVRFIICDPNRLYGCELPLLFFQIMNACYHILFFFSRFERESAVFLSLLPSLRQLGIWLQRRFFFCATVGCFPSFQRPLHAFSFFPLSSLDPPFLPQLGRQGP